MVWEDGSRSCYSLPTPRVCFGANSGHIWAFLPHVVFAQKGTFLSDSQTSDTSQTLLKTYISRPASALLKQKLGS